MKMNLNYSEKELLNFFDDFHEYTKELYRLSPNPKKLEKHLNLIEKAYIFGKTCHQDQTRKKSDLPYFIHPIHVSLLLVPLMDIDLLIAALIHDTVEDTSATIDQVRNNFGEQICLLVEGLTKPELLANETKHDRARRMLQKIHDFSKKDIRILYIKLADRYTNLLTIESLNFPRNIQNLDETEKFLIPIAESLDTVFLIDEMKLLIEKKRKELSKS
jgi:guanosine-3',5'-bis(diphosphate) 3'-pyrophosphohydrolase